MKNFNRYKVYPTVNLKDRTWPNQKITKAPMWCSVDLRDGNQALITPMGLNQKLQFFQFLVDMGFKTIEIGFPAASETEYELDEETRKRREQIEKEWNEIQKNK